MAVFGGKKQEQTTGTPDLTGMINSYRQQGYTDDQISQYLQGQGNSQQEIYAAMGTSAKVPPSTPPLPSMPPPPSPQSSAKPAGQESIGRQKIQEIAEAIIEEKWKSLLEHIDQLNEWKESTETRIISIEQDLKNLKANFDSLHKGILGKISEYDKNLLDVGTSIKSMDKIFKEVLPSFTENVNKLDRITKASQQPRRLPVRKP